jgi:hypothetical protein
MGNFPAITVIRLRHGWKSCPDTKPYLGIAETFFPGVEICGELKVLFLSPEVDLSVSFTSHLVTACLAHVIRLSRRILCLMHPM